MTGRAMTRLGVKLSFFGALIFSPSTVLADIVTVTMKLVAPPPGQSAYGVYVDPYSALINGAQTPTSVICDDFLDDTYHDETWQANKIAGSADLSGTRMATLSGFTDPTLNRAYDAVAWLSLQLLAPNADRVLLSFALWDIFAPSAVQSWLTPRAGATYYTQVQTTAQDALTHAPVDERFHLTIYSPIKDTQSCGTGHCPTAPPQEFVTVRVPEASALSALAFNLATLLGVVLLVRRRTLRSC